MARSGAVNVFLEDGSSRAEWAFRLLLEELLGLELAFTNKRPADETPVSPLINYSAWQVPGAFNVSPHGLLSEKGIREQEIVRLDFNGQAVFFPVQGGDLPFDPFAMAFYLASRYEEYLAFEPDQHGRFPARASLAHRRGFIQVAVVNRLASILRKELLKKYPDLHFKKNQYSFIPTIDVDIAFAHLGKGFVRTSGAFVKLLFAGRFGEIGKRLHTMQGKAHDPFDNFGMIREVCEMHGLRPKFFILAGNTGTYDRNLSPANKRFATLIRELSTYADIGVHPSYGAGTDLDRIRAEMDRISAITGKAVEISRQHFVRLRFPDTYEVLLQAGIREDYSMGYAEVQGFRASIASPYYHYDLNTEQTTSLRIYPFMFMDSSLADYQGLPPEKYAEAVKPVIDETRTLGGTLTGIWHNYAMADDERKHAAFREIFNYAAHP